MHSSTPHKPHFQHPSSPGQRHYLFHRAVSSISFPSFSLFSSTNRRQIPSTFVKYTRTSSLRYWQSKHRNGRWGFSLQNNRKIQLSTPARPLTPSTCFHCDSVQHQIRRPSTALLAVHKSRTRPNHQSLRERETTPHLITCTWAFITRVSATVNPSSTFDSSMNFFHPQSCSFLQNRCNVSGILHITHTWKCGLSNEPSQRHHLLLMGCPITQETCIASGNYHGKVRPQQT